MTPALAELAWAAGFYEGEGCISSTKHSLILSVSQVDVEPLNRFAAIVGCGTTRSATRIEVFRCYGSDAQRVAMALFPLLSRRRQDQILRALLRWASRRVRDPLRCHRGHAYAVTGSYVEPDGSRECTACRRARRAGPLARPSLPTAIEIRLGMREYTLAVQT